MHIFVLLQGLNIHLSLIHIDDYAEQLSKSKSIQLNARLQKFAFYIEAFGGNHRLATLGSSHGFTDQRFRSGVCIAVSASMKRSEAARQPDKRTRCVRVSDQVNSLVI